MSKKNPGRADDEKSSFGIPMEIDGQRVTKDELAGMAQAAIPAFIFAGYFDNPAEAPESVKEQAREAAIRWLRQYREAKKLFRS